jgi:hypothetical protein
MFTIETRKVRFRNRFCTFQQIGEIDRELANLPNIAIVVIEEVSVYAVWVEEISRLLYDTVASCLFLGRINQS